MPYFSIATDREGLLGSYWDEMTLKLCPVCGKPHTWSLKEGQLVVDGESIELAEAP